jgi:signal transduction histidine kinase/CheY-like chemotaxis protein
MVVVIVVVALGWREFPQTLLVVWGLLTILHTLIRWQVIQKVAREDRTNVYRLRVVTLTHFISGLLHSAPLLFFTQMTDTQRAIITILLLGLAISNVALTMGHQGIAWCYQIPTVGGSAFCWLTYQKGNEIEFASVSLGILLLVLLVILSLHARAALSSLFATIRNREQLVGLNQDLRLALERAESANRAKTRFLASASHDLRQPLHTLAMFSAALQLRPLDQKSADIARNISTAMQDLTSELDSLLDISKLDAGIVQVNTAPIDLNQLLDNIRTLYLPVAQENNLTLVVVTNALISVNSDRSLLERVVRNLVDNAIKYSEKGTIVVEAHLDRQRRNVSVSVSDQGIGIAPSEIDHVFDEFYQVDNPERNRIKGLGLGLSIVRRLTNLLGIQLQCESIWGKGSSFKITLPATVREPVRTSHSSPERFSHLTGCKVLVLDDEPAVRASMDALLSEIGCDVETVADSEQAIAAAKKRKPDILLADLRLQGLSNGIQTIKAIRLLHPNLPALLISGDTEPAQLTAANSAGIELLHKPVQLELLAKTIAKHLKF